MAELATAAADRLGMAEPRTVRLAALLPDLGRTAVGAGVWEKAGPLSTAEWEEVRLHPYHTERILARSAVLEPLARIAGMHHERQDGSGYHQGPRPPRFPPEARLLGSGCVPGHDRGSTVSPRQSPEEASEVVTSEAQAGRLDPECARAVLEAGGRPPARALTAWPAGLSDRVVEVLRLVARGLSNRSIAGALFISQRTAEHHVQHICAKIGASTRAGAAMFAMEHGLLRN